MALTFSEMPSVAQVLVRNLDDEVVERYRLRARAKGRSFEAELRETLNEALLREREELLAEIDRIRAMTPPRPPGLPLAEDLIREDRDSR